MGFAKVLRKVFKKRKKRSHDRDDDERCGPERNQTGQRSMRGGIYEPYRHHFPLKTQQINYDLDQYYASRDHPAYQQQPKFGPKLMTAGNQSVGGGSNYQLHNIPYQQNHGIMPTAQSVPALSPMGGGVMGGIPQGAAMGYNNYEQHQTIRQTTSPQNRFDPNNNFGNYSETKIAKFGENGNPLLATSQNNINQNGYQSDSYENHQPQNQMMNRRMKTSSSFNLGAAGTNYPNHMIQRAGSNISISAPFGNANPFANTNYPLHRPQRPSSAVLPTRSASDVGFMNSRPVRPGSSQGFLNHHNPHFDSSSSCIERLHGVTSPPGMNLGGTDPYNNHPLNGHVSPPLSSGFMSPPPQAEQIQNNPIAMQLRGSQANLQQALRLHEDLSRQNGVVQQPELDATMKIMQTCLDMLDSISGLVERSTTPLPQSMNNSYQQGTFEQQTGPFINHLKPKLNQKPSLKSRPVKKSSNSAFTQLRNEKLTSPNGMTHTTSGEESSEGYCGDTPSPNPRPNDDSWNIENGSLIDRDATNFNSPGPSEGGTSVDSGFVKSKSPNPNQNRTIVKPLTEEEKQLRKAKKFGQV